MKYSSVVMERNYSSLTQGFGGGGGGTRKGSALRSDPLPFYIPFFDRKSPFPIPSISRKYPFHIPILVQNFISLLIAVNTLFLRWLDWIVLRVYFPPLTVYHVGINKDIGKRLSQLLCIKMKICYDPCFIDISVTMAA